MIAVETKVAWEVGINDHVCIVFATTKPKAKWLAVKSYRAAGYGRKGEWPSTFAARRPEFDGSPLRLQPPRAYAPDYVY